MAKKRQQISTSGSSSITIDDGGGLAVSDGIKAKTGAKLTDRGWRSINLETGEPVPSRRSSVQLRDEHWHPVNGR